MLLEGVDMPRPKAAEWSQPGFYFLQSLRLEAVMPALGIDLCLHETGLTKHAQMLRDGRLRHSKLTLDFTDRPLRERQQAQDRAPVWFSKDFESRGHAV